MLTVKRLDFNSFNCATVLEFHCIPPLICFIDPRFYPRSIGNVSYLRNLWHVYFDQASHHFGEYMSPLPVETLTNNALLFTVSRYNFNLLSRPISIQHKYQHNQNNVKCV